MAVGGIAPPSINISETDMVVHCASCQKLFYLDYAPAERECPMCGSPDAAPLSSTIVFAPASNDASVTPLPALDAGAAKH
jgi:hypothetical protein